MEKVLDPYRKEVCSIPPLDMPEGTVVEIVAGRAPVEHVAVNQTDEGIGVGRFAQV